MNKKVIIIVILAVVVFAASITAIVLISVNREGVLSFTGSNSTMSSIRLDNGFTANAQRINGRHRMHANFTTANLNNLHVSNTNTTGQMYLELTQGDIVRRTDITGSFNGNIDTSAFEPGRVTVRVIYERAEEVNISVSW